MNKKTRFLLALLKGAFAVMAINSANNMIFKLAKKKKITEKYEQLDYSYKHCNVNYIKKGSGSPVVLLHDLNTHSSLYEWYNAIDYLSTSHTVYAVDLPGCGHSERPSVTYTSYMYILFIESFIKNVVKAKADIIANGLSCPIALLAREKNKDLIGKVVFVNPPSPHSVKNLPSKGEELVKDFLNLPIIGASVYNIKNSMLPTFIDAYTDIAVKAHNKRSHVSRSEELFRIYYENSHIGGRSNTYLNSSILSGFLFANMLKPLEKASDLFIIEGYNNPFRQDICSEYKAINKNVHVITLNGSKNLPHYEKPRAFSNVAKKILSDQLISK